MKFAKNVRLGAKSCQPAIHCFAKSGFTIFEFISGKLLKTHHAHILSEYKFSLLS